MRVGRKKQKKLESFNKLLKVNNKEIYKEEKLNKKE